ncbi:MAG TPA: hypothetical protein PKE06_07115 [Flavilitoribacter sp.]|nr:hypothetical protein [Flavilitoribacter sp.]HMQ88098.1 hypothetical protein [Flavilitoribacter sp.]
MDRFDEIKNIWQSRPAGMQPSLSGFNEAVRSFQSAQRRNILLLILLSVICLTAMVWVMIDYRSSLWTTRAGELIFLLMGLYLFFTKMDLLRKNNREEWLSASDFLDNLMEKFRKEATDGTRILIFFILSVAFILYLYEMLADNPVKLMTGYGGLTLFLLLVWFVYRPAMIRRQQKKISNLLSKIEDLKNQTDEKN